MEVRRDLMKDRGLDGGDVAGSESCLPPQNRVQRRKLLQLVAVRCAWQLVRPGKEENSAI